MSLIEAGQKRLVSTQVYQFIGAPPTTIPDDEYNAIPTGLQFFPEGMFVAEADTGAIEIIQGGLKCWVSPEVYQYLGSPTVTDIPDSQFNAIPNGLQVLSRRDGDL